MPNEIKLDPIVYEGCGSQAGMMMRIVLRDPFQDERAWYPVHSQGWKDIWEHIKCDGCPRMHCELFPTRCGDHWHLFCADCLVDFTPSGRIQ